jgi:hypothetical protein
LSSGPGRLTGHTVDPQADDLSKFTKGLVGLLKGGFSPLQTGHEITHAAVPRQQGAAP